MIYSIFTYDSLVVITFWSSIFFLKENWDDFTSRNGAPVVGMILLQILLLEMMHQLCTEALVA